MLDRAAYAAVGITILEDDDGLVYFQILADQGVIELMAEFLLFEDRLILDRVDVVGEGLNITRIRGLAQLCGRVEDVDEVVILGGRRMSGRSKGRLPTPIRVEVTR